MSDQTFQPHALVPKPVTAEADEFELFRRLRQLRGTLSGPTAVLITVEVSPTNIFILRTEHIERIPLG
ncbi:MAG: hypothetical protein WCF84_26310 [Anaerolineae bacterium]